MNSSEFLYRIKREVNLKDPGAEVYVYGSRARGEANANSDWDLLVITPKSVVTYEYEFTLRDKIYDLELSTNEVISVVVYTKKDWNERKNISPLFKSVKQEGIRL